MGFKCIDWTYPGTFLDMGGGGIGVLVGHVQVLSWSVQVTMVNRILGHGV